MRYNLVGVFILMVALVSCANDNDEEILFGNLTGIWQSYTKDSSGKKHLGWMYIQDTGEIQTIYHCGEPLSGYQRDRVGNTFQGDLEIISDSEMTKSDSGLLKIENSDRFQTGNVSYTIVDVASGDQEIFENFSTFCAQTNDFTRSGNGLFIEIFFDELQIQLALKNSDILTGTFPISPPDVIFSYRNGPSSAALLIALEGEVV